MKETATHWPNGFRKGRKKHSKIPVHFEQLINGQWVYVENSRLLIHGFPIKISLKQDKKQIPKLLNFQLRYAEKG